MDVDSLAENRIYLYYSAHSTALQLPPIQEWPAKDVIKVIKQILEVYAFFERIDIFHLADSKKILVHHNLDDNLPKNPQVSVFNFTESKTTNLLTDKVLEKVTD